jgi:glycosyltransferase involved in cell wall biosynthesis
MRNRIGLFYINDPNWTGGQDYVINAVNALSALERVKQPKIDLLVDSSVDQKGLKSRLSYQNYQLYNFDKNSNVFSKLIFLIYQKTRWKFVYPFPKGPKYENIFRYIGLSRRVYWIPDFQEEYFSNLFDQNEIEKRRRTRKWLAKQGNSTVVFSSESARKDFYRFYGPSIMAKTKILHFANPNKYNFDITFKDEILKKYGLSKNAYFICPNQFWKHKNHILVLAGIRKLIQMGYKICVVFCGKENDPRQPNYFPKLKMESEDLVLAGAVRFLGFLPKEEQMCLVAESIAVIQPSLFEGWSTTIEDAIAQDKVVIASDLEVNKEQLGDKAIYFDPLKVDDFINAINTCMNLTDTRIFYNNQIRIQQFAQSIIELN